MNFLALFLLWPFVEIVLFIQIGTQIGILPTIMLCGLSAVLGSFLVRWQGLKTMAVLRRTVDGGEMPAQQIFDGVCIFLAGILLILPGFFSDAVGFMLLLPPVRVWLRLYLSRHFSGKAVFSARTGAHPYSGKDNSIEGEFTRLDDHDKPLLKSAHTHQEQDHDR